MLNGYVPGEFLEPYAIAWIFLNWIEVYAIGVFLSYRTLTSTAVNRKAKAIGMTGIVLASTAAGGVLLYVRDISGFPPSLSDLLHSY
ncbi:hypothetical protein Q31a_43130 [Aureliella helgolandensis]|uniref:Uncharacterized protein n=1 Tax=Aureliella helgolandensis TaxID=2527968 RepID=A0A518GBI0_9BACT|nr:hypothetical protein Q31a_43130 [Aureliella helgolandensis]